MNHAITMELQFFLISILWGAIVLFAYDGFRIIRRIIRHNGFFLAIEDLIFWMIAGLFIFSMIYRENNGVIRGFSVMGMAIGMVLYHYILSDFLVSFITKIIRALLRPFRFIIKKIKQLLHFLTSIGKRMVNFLFRRLKKCNKSVRIKLNNRKQKHNAKKKKRRSKKALKKKKKAAGKAGQNRQEKQKRNIKQDSAQIKKRVNLEKL